MKKFGSAVLLALASVSFALPSFADGGVLGAATSYFGSATALVVDVPQGALVNAAYKCPMKASHSLAGAFGDENGWKQRIVGTIIGVPAGAVFGVPYGVVKGGQHALSVGWEKPFSMDSFVVSNEGE
jgi:hypothetical protein